MCGTPLPLNPTLNKQLNNEVNHHHLRLLPRGRVWRPRCIKGKKNLIWEMISGRPARVLDFHFDVFFSFLLPFASLISRWDQSIVTAVNELEIKVKPVPRPRSKTHLKPLPSTSSNILQPAEKEVNTGNGQVSLSGLLGPGSESWCRTFTATHCVVSSGLALLWIPCKRNAFQASSSCTKTTSHDVWDLQ